LVFSVCKKNTKTEDSTYNESVYNIKIINPLAGYTYAKAYTFSYKTKDLNMHAMPMLWLNHTSKNIWNNASKQSLFDNFILRNNKTTMFLDNNRQKELAEHYLTQNLLTIKYTINNETEQFALGKDCYYKGFETNGALWFYNSGGDTGNIVETQTLTPDYKNLAFT
jgi:hypothetical protein